MANNTRQATIDKLKNGERIHLYSHYWGEYHKDHDTFNVIYKNPEATHEKLIGVLPISLDTDGIPVMDFNRIRSDCRQLPVIITRLVNSMFGIKTPVCEGESVKIDGSINLTRKALSALIGCTIFGENILGLLMEEKADGTTKYLYRTDNGILEIKDIFHTTKLVIKED